MLGAMSGRVLQRIGAGVRRLLAPHCAVCRVERGDPVCPGCLADFFDSACVRCGVCAQRLPASAAATACGRCLAAAPAYDGTIALGDYAPPLDGMVTALKSGGRLDLARVFGDLLAERVSGAVSIDCLLAVPLAARRQRERGFNQSLEIARALARRRSLRLPHRLLSRTRGGPPQQSLPLQARRANVRGAFALSEPLAGLRVGVVDDVMTSGATLDEIARIVKLGGARRVVNLIVARTP
jgi:ComF family protein